MPRGPLRAALPLTLTIALASCERSRPPSPTRAAPSATPASPSSTAPPTHATSLWDASAGPVLLARGTSAFSAYVVFPEYDDSTVPDSLRLDPRTFDGDTVDLLQRGGGVSSAPIGGAQAAVWSGEGCIEWPTVAVALGADSSRAAGWSVGFLRGRVTPVPLDSIEGLAAADSARLAADVTRLVSALPVERGGTFRGIPFLVRYAYTFPAAPHSAGLVADVVRRLNQEATPLEEHTLIVAERDSADAQAGYRIVYDERTSGSEDSVETTDVLGAVRLGTPAHVALILLREGSEASAYALLERSAPARWRVRWTSVHTGC